MYVRPFSADLTQPVLRHSADSNNEPSYSFVAMPASGPATVHLDVPEGEGKQIRQMHGMLIALLAVVSLLVLVYLIKHGALAYFGLSSAKSSSSMYSSSI
jgi:hypothetical protein